MESIDRGIWCAIGPYIPMYTINNAGWEWFRLFEWRGK